jgi:hypothetical protein
MIAITTKSSLRVNPATLPGGRPWPAGIRRSSHGATVQSSVADGAFGHGEKGFTKIGPLFQRPANGEEVVCFPGAADRPGSNA